MFDPATGVTGARSHLIPHAQTPDPVPGEAPSTQDPLNYLGHLSRRGYNERLRRTLEMRFQAQGHRWTAVNELPAGSRTTTGGYPIPAAEIIMEFGPNGQHLRAWRFPNDPALYLGLPTDIDAALARFEIPSANLPQAVVLH